MNDLMILNWHDIMIMNTIKRTWTIGEGRRGACRGKWHFNIVMELDLHFWSKIRICFAGIWMRDSDRFQFPTTTGATIIRALLSEINKK